MTLGKQEVRYKQTKKMRIIRHFKRKNSMFKDFLEVTEKMTDAAFEKEKAFLKTARFIKPEKEGLPMTEIQNVHLVIQKYYGALYEQFVYQIASVNVYPVIGWLDFVRQTEHGYKIVDGSSLTSGDVDRAFIACNFEEVELEANDDKSLCRYEFFELFTRLAKIKFFEKGTELTISGSLERLI